MTTSQPTNGPIRFRTPLILTGKTSTGFRVPPEVVAALGPSKKPPVRVTINGYTYRSTVAVMGGEYWLGISAENRAGAQVNAGEEIDVAVELDTQPREVVVPPDFAAAIEQSAPAKAFFEGLSYSNKRRFVMGVEEAKSAEARQRRIAKSVKMMEEGKM